MRKITVDIVILSIIMIGMVIPAGFSGEVSPVVMPTEKPHMRILTTKLMWMRFSKIRQMQI